ncbi:hypothetical protein PCANC_17157 [Puccinia coronata f. sp. avenae]|uniref:Uncharacterized protein n=1 Tax=Puccinia coronata f. sp. avenae TaxID=200324 RepID=A0A2N5S6G2_9BASI|nr:hypothetical protein PCASD_22648 [Puccinia coronata f. sp. avenae]PLW08816.1 hypothetical protein PCANC_25971 [Puccinia coronata f. sp. avenae]PLW37697.1 hypothetical protein PCANC_17157 [Puccinia coronata f. sp. avenae]PLW38696.1 hypothetical protein PCASD_11513 [Puccinia coronata f. sp. avenae]
MSQTFTPAAKFSTNERDWQAEIGMLPWTTSIVFSKESLVRFLKTLDLEVDPNMSQLKKLPKFATCGVLSEGESNLVQPPALAAPAPSDAQAAQSDLPAFIPTRKVREQPGGGSAQIASLLGGDRQSDAMNWVPPPIAQQATSHAAAAPSAPGLPEQVVPTAEEDDAPRVMMPDGSRFIPSRKVREPVGGHSSMADILGGR